MKTLLFIAICLLSINSVIGQHHYFPDSNAVWSVWENKFFVNGDSIVNEKAYKKYFITNDSTLTSYAFFALLREDTSTLKVFVIPPTTYEEKLLYDFSLSVGDSVTVFPAENDNSYWYSSVPANPEIEQIDSVQIDGELRKRYKMTDKHNYMESEYWIEGIGSTYGIFNSGFGSLHIMYIPHLLCFKQDGEIIYNDPLQNGCSGRYPDGIIEKNQNDFVNIYPNPVDKLLFFESVAEIFEIRIFASSGIELDKFEPDNIAYQINVTDYPSGIYYIKITGRNFTQNMKFIKR